MKKTILLSSLFAVGAVCAETVVESANAIGALDLAISNAPAQTLIAVPFLGYGTTDDAIAVKDMVKTSDLADDSKLYVPDGSGAYNTWKLKEGAWVADKKVTVGAGAPVAGETDSQDTATASRGDSFWLEPIFKDSKTSGTVFLLGQAANDSGESSVAANKWNLIGNASVVECKLDQLEGTTDDQIVVQVDGKLRYYTFKEGKGWRYRKPDFSMSNPAEEEEKLTIAAGQGFWYKSATARVIDWSTGKTKVSAGN